MSTVQIKINTVDKSSLIDWESVKKTEVLTKEPNTLEFLIRSYPTKTYLPALGDTVQMYDNGVIIFGGVVIEIDNQVDGLLAFNKIICKDWYHVADQLMVAKTYTNQTATAIAQDIITTYCPGFTSVNVDVPITLDNVVFNYLTVTAALEKLIKLTGADCDFYFDYDKDLHFFLNNGTYLAPFTLTDTSANFDWHSLQLNDDLSQLRNKVTVRGGVTTGSQVTNQKVADGKQVIFFVGYSFSSIAVSKALAASPTSFSALTTGADGKDLPASFDCLYNPDTGLLIFPDGSKPAINDVIKFIGTPSFPVIVQIHDNASVALYGTYESVIVDKTIVSKAIARNRAMTELIKYSQPLFNGSFVTRTSGLKAGQVITINSTLRNITGDYKIQRVMTKLRTPSVSTSDFTYLVEIVSTQSVTMNDVLKKLWITNPSDQIVVGQNEIVDTVYSEDESITISEVISSSITHNTQMETLTIGESAIAQALDYAVQFVVGPQIPSGFLRQFILNGSPLG